MNLTTILESLSTTDRCMEQKVLQLVQTTDSFQQGGRDNKVDFTSAASAIDRNFYMDDLAKNIDSLQAAITCYKELVDALKRSGFTLEK